MFKRLKALFAILAFGFQSSAFAVLEIVITEGTDSARPIAIVPFKFDGIGEKPSALSDVIAADLMRSGKFKPLALENMPQLPATDDEVDYAAWVDQGVEAVLVGSITQQPGRTLFN